MIAPNNNLCLLDLELVTLKLAIVYKATEFANPGEIVMIDVPTNPLTGIQYYKKLYVVHSSDKEFFLAEIKKIAGIVIEFSEANRIEKEDVQRKFFCSQESDA